MNEHSNKVIIETIQRKWQKLIDTDNIQVYRHYKQLWEFIRNDKKCNEILERLINANVEQSISDCENILTDKWNSWSYFHQEVGGEKRHIASFIKLNDELIKPIVEDSEEGKKYNAKRLNQLISIGRTYAKEKLNGKNIDFDTPYSLKCFYQLFLEPVIEYLFDNLENNSIILFHLYRLKFRCENFEQEKMLDEYESAPKFGEKKLKNFVHKYLFDQGISFNIETKTNAGNIDLTALLPDGEKCPIEFKIYNNNKSEIIHGLETQILAYLNSENQTTGYFIVFNVSEEKEIQFQLEKGKDGFICFKKGNKTIYIQVIDLVKRKSASVKKYDQVILTSADFKN